MAKARQHRALAPPSAGCVLGLPRSTAATCALSSHVPQAAADLADSQCRMRNGTGRQSDRARSDSHTLTPPSSIPFGYYIEHVMMYTKGNCTDT